MILSFNDIMFTTRYYKIINKSAENSYCIIFRDKNNPKKEYIRINALLPNNEKIVLISFEKKREIEVCCQNNNFEGNSCIETITNITYIKPTRKKEIK